MLKKIKTGLLTGLLALWAASTNAFTNETLYQFCEADHVEFRYACRAYVAGVLDANRAVLYSLYKECKEFKTLSAVMVVAAFQTEYKQLGPEDRALGFLVNYIHDNGGCNK